VRALGSTALLVKRAGWLMDDEKAGAATAQQAPPPEREDTIQASISRLIDSGKDLAGAELDWAKLKGRSLLVLLRRGVFFGIIAVSALMVGFSLLLVAGIVALYPIVGLLYATLIVIGISFALAVIFGLMARGAFRELLGDDEP
jgi:hypothetical protein